MTPSRNLLGAIGETKVTLDLMELGFYVLHPVHEGGSVDLVALRGSNLYRIQVKYRHLQDGFIDIHWALGEGTYTNTCDVIAVYVPELETVFYVPSSICGDNKAKKRLHLREADKDSESYLFNYTLFPAHCGLKTSPIDSCS
jgi:hypothetical protein